MKTAIAVIVEKVTGSLFSKCMHFDCIITAGLIRNDTENYTFLLFQLKLQSDQTWIKVYLTKGNSLKGKGHVDLQGAFASDSGCFPFVPILSRLKLTSLKVLLLLAPLVASPPSTLATNSTCYLTVFYIRIKYSCLMFVGVFVAGFSYHQCGHLFGQLKLVYIA